jgi:predicted Zn-dependent protease
VALAACGALLAACGRGGEPEPGFNIFSPEQDVEIGRKSADEVRRLLPPLEVADVEAYLRDVGARLADRAPGERFAYEFYALDVREINAFALPGGIIFVTRGTLETVRDEGELAGVLAHEISHVGLRHGTNQLSKAHVAQAGIDIYRGIAGGGAADAGSVAESLGGLGLNTLFLKFSREAETEADMAGVRMLAEAGYDPIEMARFFDTMRANERSVPEFLSDHPDTGNRAQAVAEAREALPRSSRPITVTDGFWRMKSALRLLPPARSMAGS